jgi:small subunit ribosomal protein S2
MKIKNNFNQNNFLLSDLIKSKVYLGLNKSMKDPSISPYLLGIRHNFCIFDLNKTIQNLKKALKIIAKINQSKKTVFFVGFPESEKKKFVMLLKNKKHSYSFGDSWVNGILTNGKDLFLYKNNFLKNLELKKEKEKAFFYEKFGGLLNLNKKPDLIVIFDHSKSLDAYNEASKMQIPVISFINSGNNPSKVDYPIPGNFTSNKAGKLYYNLIKHLLN